MECILKSAEDINQEWTKVLEQVELGTGYKSIFTINGKPILPPLMTQERRVRMQKYRQAAMAIEKQRQLKDFRQTKPSVLTAAVADKLANNACSQLTDASTNTELPSKLAQQPLIVMGRFKQQLTCSETLIYDNNCNAIIKFNKPSWRAPAKPEQAQLQPLLEESFDFLPQYAVIKEAAAEYGVKLETLLETEPEPLESGKEVQETLEPDAETKPNELATLVNNESIKINSPNQNKTSVIHNIIKSEGEPLKRASTSPALLRVTKETLKAKIAQSYNDVDRRMPLHPQLWKRFHSYPFATVDRAGPSSPNTSSTGNLFKTPSNSSNNEMQLKPCLVPDLQLNTADNPKLKVSNANPSKVSSSKTSKRTPRAFSSIRYEAHASSHANAHLASSDSKTRVSSTQRRLSYDPRATIKRAVTPKKVAPMVTQIPTYHSSDLATPLATPAAVEPPAILKHRLLEDMEKQQRQRFQLLIMQQTDEQQRMQVEFQAQQQLLMNNLLSDLSTYSSDKDGETDIGNSESSSMTSLPQSRTNLNPNEPDASI